jgi:galactokinase
MVSDEISINFFSSFSPGHEVLVRFIGRKNFLGARMGYNDVCVLPAAITGSPNTTGWFQRDVTIE